MRLASVADPIGYALNPFAIPTLLAASALVALMVLVLVREGRTQTGRAFALIAVSAAAWLVCFSAMYCALEPPVALWWAKAAYLFIPAIPAAIYQFVLVVTGAEEVHRGRRRVVWGISVAFALLMSQTNLLFDAVDRRSWGFYPRYEWASLVFVAGFIGIALLAMRQSIRELRESLPGWHRDRIRAFTMAFGIAYLATFDFLAAYGVPLYPFGYIPVLAFVALAARAVLRYRLVDLTPAFAAPQIVATAADALIAYDTRNRIRFANPAACELLDLDERALAGLPIETLIDGHSAEDNRLREALARGEAQHLNGGLRNRGGERIEVRVSISPLKAPPGPPAGALLVAEDVRDLRAAQASSARLLRESEARFDALANTESAAVFLFRDQKLVLASPGLALLSGRPAEELVGLRFVELAEPSSQPALRRHAEAVMRGDGPIRFETRFATPQGGARVVDLSLSATGGDGAPTVLGLAFDITEGRLAEQALATERERIAKLLGAGRLLSVLIDGAGQVSHASPALLDVLGCSEDEVVGREWCSFAPEPDREAVRRDVQASLQTPDLRTEEIGELVTSSGETRLVSWNTALLPEAGGSRKSLALVGLDITEQLRAKERVSVQAARDALTGLVSREQLLIRILACLELARSRPQYRFALILGDLDRFRLVNDSLGHSAGDKLLTEVARRLETCVRQGDLIARVGGDEFAVLLEDIADSDVARSTSDRVHRALERPFSAEDRELFITMSVGIVLNRSRYRDPEEVLRDAHTAMSTGRRVGRARVREFDTGMHAHARDRLQLESDLRRAVERDELRLVYQPVVSLASNEVVAFEALLRWDRPGQGRVPPDRFIGIAEETGLILGIGRWALQTACEKLKGWQDRFGLDRDIHINVNVSPLQFAEEDFGDQVAHALASSGAAPRGLKLEITESVIMSDPDSASELLIRLRARGVGICLDDFGTGYSSLSYLTRFPAETLKIDQSFISQLVEGTEQEEMVRAIIGLAHALKMKVIAEGVETREQLERLRTLGCEFVQGFLLARPLDPRAAEDLLENPRALVQPLRSIDGGRR